MVINTDTLMQAGLAGAMAVVGWLATRCFNSLQRDIAKLEGKLDALQKDIQANTTATVLANAEVKALWRTVEGGNSRTSDTVNGGSDHG